jgi:hypothetical protein
VIVVKQTFSDVERRAEFLLLDPVKRGKHGDAAFPDITGLGELIEEADIVRVEMRPNDMFRRAVDEVPAVDVVGVCEVGVVDPLFASLVGALMVCDEQEQRERAFLVPLRREKR